MSKIEPKIINTIQCEDCVKTIDRLPNNSIDMVLTSPPYDGLRTYNGYSFDFETIATGLLRVLKVGGVVVWVVSDETKNGSESGTSFRQALYFKEIGFNLHDTMIYMKNNPMPNSANRYNQQFEYMFVFSKGNPMTFNPITVEAKHSGTANYKNRGTDGNLNYTKRIRNERRKVGNVFTYSIGGGITTKDKIAYQHPAIMHEQLAKDQIITWSNKGDLIYDPFMGSGTTAKMALINDRKFLGSEISEEYCNIANKRINHLLTGYF